MLMYTKLGAYMYVVVMSFQQQYPAMVFLGNAWSLPDKHSFLVK